MILEAYKRKFKADRLKVGGIIILGLMVSSIHRFARELGSNHVVKAHVEKRRTEMLDQSAANEHDSEQLEAQNHSGLHLHPAISAPFNQHEIHPTLNYEQEPHSAGQHHQQHSRRKPLRNGMRKLKKVRSRQPKIQLLKEEKDRFDAMRAIQHSTHRFKRYSALTMSVIACKYLTIPCLFNTSSPFAIVGLLWCVGAIGFWKAEQKSQGLSYFQALYFCYVSLLTIGYGDLSPKSNAGKPFFVVWSLIAVPTMTILISDMGDTVIASFKRGTFKFADWTVLPKAGVWKIFVQAHPWLRYWLQQHQEREAEKEAQGRIVEGFHAGPAEEEPQAPGPTIEEVALLDNLDEHALARKLAFAIRRVAANIGKVPPKRYSYEQWAECTRLIRFTKINEDLEREEDDLGLVDWDWIGEDSPMLADVSESEWILDRLCESLNRYMVKQHFSVREKDSSSTRLERTDDSKKTI